MNPDVQRIETALRYIPADDRDTWLKMGMAIKSELDESGFDIWDRWSKESESYHARDARNAWRSFRKNGTTIGTLFYEAKQRGYRQEHPLQPVSAAEIERRQREARDRAAAEQTKRERGQQAAAEQAAEIWKLCAPVESHGYLTKKGIKAHGVRVYSGPLAINGMRCAGCLVVPIRNAAGELRSLEFISPEGEKRFLPNGAKSGNYFAIGEPAGRVLIAEGYATGATLHEHTGCAVAVAFDAGNLEPVALAIKAKLPEAEIIIAADDDALTVCKRHKEAGITRAIAASPDGCGCNPGLTRGHRAASAAGGRAIAPTFTPAEQDAGNTDFNDLAKIRPDAVRGVLKVLMVAPPAHFHGQGPGADGWSDPEPLPALPAVAPLNYSYLPPVLCTYVRDIADRMQCPDDFAAAACLTMAASAIGRKVGIRPKRADNWTVVPNLWCMIVGRSGIMKSPAMSAALIPLRKMQAEAFEEFERAKIGYEADARLQEIAITAAKAKASQLMKKGNRDAAAMELANAQASETKEPTARRFIVVDSTVEALAETLEENPNGVLVDRDELSGWLRSLDKEGQQEARAFYLQAANGDSGFTVDRIGRGRNRHIEAVCVSIVGGIQPGVLAGYVRDTQRGGSGDDGLLQRFGMMVYPDVSPEWRNVDRLPDQGARAAIDALIRRLCDLNPHEVGAETDENEQIPYLRFNPAAQAMFDEWREEMEPRIRNGDDHPAVTSHLSKYRKLIPALALINHLSDGGAGPVSETALARAMQYSDYLESHARRVYSYASRPELEGAKSILAKIRAGKLKPPFRQRDIYINGWSGLSAPEEAGAAIRLLVDYGYLRELQQEPDKNGRPSPRYEAHPSIKGAA